ncbi:MAG TPA: hemolysin [Gammaproteobacteria bacterium]|nr:hemolysin [Gammaproteobacteria bacterium]
MREQMNSHDPEKKATLKVRMAQHLDEIRDAQRLRYRIFAEEMGAKLHTLVPGHDVDEFDDYCQHLLVWDESAEMIAGYTRVLLHEDAQRAGRFYSETEFHLGTVLARSGRFMELGRTCIHPNYRNGLTIATLWMGVAEILQSQRYDYLIGCCSIGLDRGIAAVHALIGQLRHEQLLDASLEIRARHRLPPFDGADQQAAPMPPLLKAYFRLGAQISADPCWDEDFNVADVFILLDQQRVAQRYARHFRVAA